MKLGNREAFEQILAFYKSVLKVDVKDYESNMAQLVLPIIPVNFIESLCSEFVAIARSEPSCLDLPHDLVIVGDLHGHILDLLRILRKFGLPPTSNYLFLGDIIDRGEFSTETITLILLLKVLFPKNVFIIRGNHEFSDVFQACGFTQELLSIYGNPAVESYFSMAFSYMPIAAVIDKSILCVHGGIGPGVMSLNQLRDIERPIYNFQQEPISSILWSDPIERMSGFAPSTRGTGYFFGEDIIMNFFELNNLELMVRGHEMVQNGVDVIHGGRVVTVFSASYYCGISSNRAGVLVLKANGDKDVTTFPPLNYFKRPLAHFKNINIIPLGPLRPIKNFDLASSSSRDSGSLPSLVCPNDKAQSKSSRPNGMKINSHYERVPPIVRSLTKMGEKRCNEMKRIERFSTFATRGIINPDSKKVDLFLREFT